MMTTEQILKPMPEGLDFLMISPGAALYPDPGNSRLRSPALSAGYILSNTRKRGFTVKYIDMDACLIPLGRLLDFIAKNRPGLIGITAVTTMVKTAAAIARSIKEQQPDMLICLGGVHATMVPGRTIDEFKEFDFIIRGEGEEVIPDILSRLREGRSDIEDIPGVMVRGCKKESNRLVENIELLPMPAWDLFDLFRYPGVDLHRTRRELPIITARGCPFDCCFCCRQPGMRKVRYRSAESIIDEIAAGITDFGAEAFIFTDETFTLNKTFTTKVCEAIITRGFNKKIRWSCSTRVDQADPEIFKLMRSAGCYDVFFGFESGDDRLLEIAGKRITTAQMRTAVKYVKDAGLASHGCFILGLPGETEETIEKARLLAAELDIRGVSFPIAVPFPGTRLETMAERGEYGLRIFSKNWDDYGKQYPGIMEQGNLTVEKLLFYQQKSYLHHPVKWGYCWPEDELDRSKKKN